MISRCTETCTMSPPVTSCTVQQCTDISAAFDLASIHATVSTTAPTPIDEQVVITCAEGYALSPDHTPATVVLPAVDGGETVELVEQQIFTAPSPDVSSTVQLTGANPVKIEFPAGAWPAGETRQLKVTVVKVCDQHHPLLSPHPKDIPLEIPVKTLLPLGPSFPMFS